MRDRIFSECVIHRQTDLAELKIFKFSLNIILVLIHTNTICMYLLIT